MIHKYYLPDSEAERRIWLDNFAHYIGVYPTVLGIAPATVTKIVAMALYYGQVLDYYSNVEQYVRVLTLLKKDLVSGSQTIVFDIPTPPAIPTHVAGTGGIFVYIKDFVDTLKKNTALTQEIIGFLRIEGDAVSHDFDNIVVDAKIALKNGHAYLSWKHNGTTAVDIVADYGDGKGFIDVGRYNRVHFLDAHLPDPGVSKSFVYKLRYVVNDEQVGLWSNPISISVVGF